MEQTSQTNPPQAGAMTGYAMLCRSWSSAPSFAIVLIFVYGFILFTLYLSFTDSRESCLRSTGSGSRTTASSSGCARLGDIAVHNLLIFGSLYIIICCALRVGAGNTPRPEDSRRGVHPDDLSLSDGPVVHRDRRRLEVVPAEPPASGCRRSCGLWGWESFTFEWIKSSGRWRSTPSSSRRSGRPRGLSWRCFWLGCAGSTTR